MKFKSGTRFSMQAQGDSAEILIYEEIGASFWGGGVDPKQFAADLKALGDVSTINVRINSPGGDVFDGATIYNQLAQHKATINVFVDGLAASAASLIAMAGDKISMAENAMMMIHNAWAMVAGDSEEMRSMADVLEKINGTMAATYSKRSGQSSANVLKLMTAETWFTADEAIENGFADELAQAPEAAANARFNLSHFKNAPKKFPQAEADETAVASWAPSPEWYRARLELYRRSLA